MFLLWGPTGAAFVTLLSDSEGTLSAEIRKIGEKAYLEHADLRILQAKWMPQVSNAHIIILNNDNFIRFYDSKDPQVPLTTLCVGQDSSIPFVSDQRLNSSSPVDFDFGPDLPKSEFQSIFILRSSGAIFIVLARHFEAMSKYIAEIHGPIEEESLLNNESLPGIASTCSKIAVTKKYPPLLILGYSDGTLQHCTLLPSTGVGTITNEYNFEEKLMTGDVFISNNEVLKLEDSTNLELILDANTQNHYVCIHSRGAHLISIQFIPQLLNFLKDGGKFEPLESEFQCILSWAFDASKISSEVMRSTNQLQIRGMAFTHTFPGKLFSLLENMEAYSFEYTYDIAHLNTLLKTTKLDEGFEPPEFYFTTQSNLKNPIMCSKSDIEGKEMMAVLNELTKKVDANIDIQEKAIAALFANLKGLEVETDAFTNKLQNLIDARKTHQERSEAISELYEIELIIDQKVMKDMATLQTRFKNVHGIVYEQEKKCIEMLQACKLNIEQERIKVKGLNKEVKSLKGKEGEIEERQLFTSTKFCELKSIIKRQNEAIGSMKNMIKGLMSLKQIPF